MLFNDTPGFILTAAACALVLALSGCGGGSSSTKMTEKEMTEKEMTETDPPQGPTAPPTTPQGPTAPPTTPQGPTAPPTTRTTAQVQVPLSTVITTQEAVVPGAVEALKKAADAEPNPGSVTQSSNTNNAGVTTDQVEVTAEYGATPRFSVTNGDQWSIGMDEGNPVAMTGLDSPWKGAELRKKLRGGTLYVDAYTDIEAPTPVLVEGTPVTLRNDPTGTRYFWMSLNNRERSPGTRNGVDGIFSCTVGGGRSCPSFAGNVVDWTGTNWIFTPTTRAEGGRTEPDADYLAGGVWLYVPDTASSTDDYRFGAFADGNDPFTQANIMALTGTATYAGDATGVYSQREGSSTAIRYFDGDVSLTANFGTADALGTISGSITNFEVDSERVAGRLDLGEAAIGSANSGFFNGAVTGSDGDRTYAGKWGGQFFGNGAASTDHPGSVAGTFGGKSTDEAVNFVGAFGAHKR